MSQAIWSDALSLNVAAMDDIHQEFVATLAALQAAPDGELVARLDDMIAHTEEHFAQESVWMKAIQFPPIHCHEEEHDKVLVILKDVRRRAAAGDLALGRNLARELMPWLEHHAATMDNMLAQIIRQNGYEAQRSTGTEGRPG
ncbi:MAG: hemerythrin domain-containing protein [Rhodocyclaceae bacterium]|nr:hemerythrin domain-containing protein [Rhodocyclaceae bacterium]